MHVSRLVSIVLIFAMLVSGAGVFWYYSLVDHLDMSKHSFLLFLISYLTLSLIEESGKN